MQFLLLDPAEILRIGSYRCMIDGGSCYFEFAERSWRVFVFW